MTLQSDVSRTLRVRVASNAYEGELGGIWSEFGSEVAVDATPRRVVLALDTLYYPQWAKAAWLSPQGWTSSDAEARQIALLRFTGLIFAPAATFDAAGELAQVTESSFLQIDNIYFC